MNEITMTKKGNAKYDGKKYVAVPPVKLDYCTGCAFEKIYCGDAWCLPREREDNKSVIFVLKPKKEKTT